MRSLVNLIELDVHAAVARHLDRARAHMDRASELLEGLNLKQTPLDHLITQNKGKRT